MTMHPASGAALAARFRVLKVAAGAAVMAALAGGWVLASAPAGAAAGPRLAPAGGQLAAWKVTAQMPVQGNSALAVNPVSHAVYVGGGGADVEVLSGATGQQTGEISLPSERPPASAAVNPTTGAVYVASGQAVYAVSGKTNKVTATIADTLSPDRVAVNPATNTVYVTNTGSDTVTVINGRTNTVTTTIDIGNPIDGIAVDPSADTVYVADGPATFGADGTVTVISGGTNTVVASVSAGPNLHAITVNEQTDTIYAAGNGSLAVISGTTDTVTTTVKAGANGIVADPRTDTIYLIGGPLVSAMSGRTNKVIGDFVIGDPNAGSGVDTTDVAVDPAAGAVYVSYLQGQDVFEAPYLGIIATCASDVVISPGTGCAKVAAAFAPVAASFSSPSQGVLLGRDPCPCIDDALMGTSDAGKHWSFLPATSLGSFPSVSDAADNPDVLFTSPDDGWLSGRWHTSDGGASWQWAGPGGRAAVAMTATAKTVYAAAQLPGGARGLFSRPVGGTHWTRIFEVHANVTSLAAIGPAIWLTSQTHLWTTADGRHWHEYPARCPGTGYRLASVTAASPSHVAFLCARPAGTGPADPKEVLTSANGGRTVQLAGPAPATGIPHGFAAPPGNPAVITIAADGTGANSAARLYRSANGGRTWTTLPIKGTALASLSYTSRTSGWLLLVTGPAGKITLLRTTDSGRTWHKINF